VRWRAIVVSVIGWIVFGAVLPFGALLWLIEHYEPPYAVDQRHIASPKTAFGDHPTIAPVTGALAAGRGATAFYAERGVVTIVRSPAASSLVDAYASELRPTTSTSYTLNNYSQADYGLGGGRAARLIRIGDAVFAFVAPNRGALDALVASTPALARHRGRAIGNAAFDDHRAATVAVFVIWMLASLAAAFALFMRFAKPGPTLPPPGTAAVDAAELGRRLLALGDGTHPFVVAPGNQPGEFFVDWRFDATFNAFLASYGEHKLFRIRLRLNPATHVVDSTDFQSERAVSAGILPGSYANVRWQASRGYVFFDREAGWVNGASYRFDVTEMRVPVVGTITGAGWTYRPRL